jgi:hypothetical protein
MNSGHARKTAAMQGYVYRNEIYHQGKARGWEARGGG